MEGAALSGAIGENPACKVPDRVKKYLVGDICVCINNRDIPIEVKFRTSANSFQAIYRVKDTTCYYTYTDCILVPTLPLLCSLLNGISTKNNSVLSPLLNSTLTGWLDHCNILALRSSKSKEWYFIIKDINKYE